MENVGIVGIGQTKYKGENREQTYSDLVYEATNKAVEDAGMTIDDIDNIVTVSNDFWDGRTISSMADMEACGSMETDVTTTEDDGTSGVLLGYMRTLAEFDTTLVVARSKISETNPNIVTNAMFDPIFERKLGLDGISSSALQARRYMEKYGITEEQCAKVSVKNHKNAQNNPYAHLPLDIDVEDVLDSRVLADPIKLLDSSPASDGASAAILAKEDKAKEISEKPVWIKGLGQCVDSYHLGDRDLAEVKALRKAAEDAYEMAGIGDPKKDIDVAELYDAFSYQELMWYEGLKFCGGGEGGDLLESGDTQMEGEIPVNPSGGVISSHPVLAAGMARVSEACLQIRGEADDRQISENVNNALAHGINGPCGQSHCVLVLGD